MQSFYNTRDKAFEIAEKAIDNIISTIVEDNVPEENETKTEQNKENNDEIQA